jgi:hypothetical protein
MIGTFYLNNTGSKWVILPRKTNMQVRLIDKAANYDKIRIVEYFEAFGNFATYNLKYKGKRISGFADSVDENNIPILYVNYLEKP